MLQPFEQFKLIYIDRLVKLKKRWLVSQSYHRAYDHFEDEHKTAILLTDYDVLGGAKIHLNAVSHDKYAAILDLENETHKNKIMEMLSADSKYQVFWAVVDDKKKLQERINKRYKENMRRYIERHTKWRIDRNTTIRPSVEVTFGELFIVLKHAGQVLRLKFEEIEKI